MADAQETRRAFHVQRRNRQDVVVDDLGREIIPFQSGISTSDLKRLIKDRFTRSLADVKIASLRFDPDIGLQWHVTDETFPDHGREGQQPIVVWAVDPSKGECSFIAAATQHYTTMRTATTAAVEGFSASWRSLRALSIGAFKRHFVQRCCSEQP
ncbi:unnamed protein product [Vitrella brassicaformis CCMP3155]|uniref:Uncharacterized protein n=1 Tax=Vitrella brassicaformis (strain CCMP3155) TaxID=1169540 RepID=A0A0G4G5B7_VITBC|nr:unnamed protein product [Vitrella brassicaformis CCMP3155]|eukprot:CEM23739.1 unnamed protein product [Vitrella brassicaformis CCMP3155]